MLRMAVIKEGLFCIRTPELTIKGLTEEDSGTFELEALINSKLQYSKHEVKVIDAVAQPSVTCEINHNGTTLLCSADLQPLTQFTWRSLDGPDRPGSELFIPESENHQSVYTCVVRNPVSEKTTEFNLKDCHTEKVSSLTRAVPLSIVFIVLLIVIILLALRWYRWKSKKCMIILSEATERTSVEEMQIGTERGSKSHSYTESQDSASKPLLEKGHVIKKTKIFEAMANNESNSSASRQINFHNMSEAEDQETNPHQLSSMNTPLDKEEKLVLEQESSVGGEDNTTTGQSQTPKQSPCQTKVDQIVFGRIVPNPQNKTDPKSENSKEDSQSGVQTQEPNQADTELDGGGDGLLGTNPTHSNLHSIMEYSGDANQERDTVGSSLNTSQEHLPPQLPPSETSETQPDLHNIDPTSTQPYKVQSKLMSSDNNEKDSPLDQNVKNVVGKPPQKPKRTEKEELGIIDKPTNKKELVPDTCNQRQPQSSPVDDGQLAVCSEKSDSSVSEAEAQETKPHQLSSMNTPPAKEEDLESEPEPPVGGEDNTTTGQSQTPKQSPSQTKVDQPDLGLPVLKPQNKSDPISEDPKEDSQSGVQIQEPNQADTEMCGGEDGQFRINPTHSNLHSIMDDSGDANQERDTVGSSINTSLEHLLPQLPPSETSETQPDLHNIDPTSAQPNQVQSSLLSSDNNEKDSPLDQNVKNVVGKPPEKTKRTEKEERWSKDGIHMTEKTDTTSSNSSMHEDTKLQNNNEKSTNNELVQNTSIPVNPQSSVVDDCQLVVGAEKTEVEGQEEKVSEDKNIIPHQTSSGSTPPDYNTHLTSDQEENNLIINKAQDSQGKEKEDVESKRAFGKEDNAGASGETSMGHSPQKETKQPGQNDKQQTNDNIESVPEKSTNEQTLPMSPLNQQVPDQPNDKQENKPEPQTEESKVNTDTSPDTTQKQQDQDCKNNESEQD
ncbi:hypothetical protein UPYG_G00308740 [Umbra pygmaea]|uniref:Ig-like domain-containing protein n=1 Tax=Umbra pygmaea TaxID=75934 RepID=A0ABD0W3H1_UMBPY